MADDASPPSAVIQSVTGKAVVRPTNVVNPETASGTNNTSTTTASAVLTELERYLKEVGVETNKGSKRFSIKVTNKVDQQSIEFNSPSDSFTLHITHMGVSEEEEGAATSGYTNHDVIVEAVATFVIMTVAANLMDENRTDFTYMYRPIFTNEITRPSSVLQIARFLQATFPSAS